MQNVQSVLTKHRLPNEIQNIVQKVIQGVQKNSNQSPEEIRI